MSLQDLNLALEVVDRMQQARSAYLCLCGQDTLDLMVANLTPMIEKIKAEQGFESMAACKLLMSWVQADAPKLLAVTAACCEIMERELLAENREVG